ncbi:MAG: hypothetical protein ABR77_04820 [Acidimicrobiia bacterium BACL6 MAG-120322-bin79]|jgi:hypothetical protein|nr:MAG: hypothetical protein ABR77_04820 [Acidimicrobiia bacterium BACL6 MAG-120322-bin79]
MGIVLSMLVAVTSVLPAQLPPIVGTITQPNSVLSTVEAVRHIEFDLDIATFTRQRFLLRRQYPTLDWTSDGCSAPIVGSQGRSFNFRSACNRHDFGYRNFKNLGLFDTSTRTLIDEQLHRDMNTYCDSQRRTFKVRCIAWSEIFYTMVRAAGGP